MIEDLGNDGSYVWDVALNPENDEGFYETQTDLGNQLDDLIQKKREFYESNMENIKFSCSLTSNPRETYGEAKKVLHEKFEDLERYKNLQLNFSKCLYERKKDPEKAVKIFDDIQRAILGSGDASSTAALKMHGILMENDLSVYDEELMENLAVFEVNSRNFASVLRENDLEYIAAKAYCNYSDKRIKERAENEITKTKEKMKRKEQKKEEKKEKKGFLYYLTRGL